MNWRDCFAPWRIVEWIHWTNWTMSSRKLGLLAMQWIVMKCVVNPALDPIKPREFLRIQNVAYGVLWVTCELMSRNLRIGTRVLIFNFIYPVPIRNPFLFVSGQQLSFTVRVHLFGFSFHALRLRLFGCEAEDVRPSADAWVFCQRSPLSATGEKRKAMRRQRYSWTPSLHMSCGCSTTTVWTCMNNILYLTSYHKIFDTIIY